MEEIILGLAIIMTFGLVMLIYRQNLRLPHYLEQHLKSWAVADKVNDLGRYLALGGGLATLPIVVLLVFAPDTVAAEWLIYLAACGIVALVVAVPMTVIALIWRTSLSPTSMFSIIKVLVKTMKRAVQRYWWMVTLCLMAVVFLVFFLPVIQYIAYFVVWVAMGKFGLLNGNEDEFYKDDGFLTKGEFYNYRTGKFDNGLDPGGLYN